MSLCIETAEQGQHQNPDQQCQERAPDPGVLHSNAGAEINAVETVIMWYHCFHEWGGVGMAAGHSSVITRSF